jgi:hypothetical protein
VASDQWPVASKSPPAPTTATLRYRSPYIGCMVTFCNFVVARQYSIVKDRGRTPGRSRCYRNLLVGLGRIELPTSPLSGVRSSQLSYRPKPLRTADRGQRTAKPSRPTAALGGSPEQLQYGGAGRDRTGDLLNANQALSQLSYSPRWVNSESRPIGRERRDQLAAHRKNQ